MNRTRGFLLLSVALVVVACSAGSAATSVPAVIASASAPAKAELTIYGTSSLKGALKSLKAAYEAAVPGTTLTIATDSSATLRTQIEQGAPADIFLSADRQNPEALVEAGLTDGPALDFAGNTLTIIVPKDAPATVASPADLAKPGMKIVAAGADVPVTHYADQVIAKLAALPGYPHGFASAYAANVVSKEQNVKAVVAKIELGEADAAIVYATDATASDKVNQVLIPPGANVLAIYAGVVIKGSAQAPAAHAFLEWLAGPIGQTILADAGFVPPS